jgi:hypothetical protein
MKLYKNFDPNKLEAYNILFATTSEQDYEMTRLLLLEHMPNVQYSNYVLVEGSHCSCYGFDETEWEATEYTTDELIKILKVNCWGLREQLANYFGIKQEKQNE